MKLTEAQRRALAAMADDCGGVAGSPWYHASSVGRRTTMRSLIVLGLARMNGTAGAGLLYAISEAGRAALREGGNA